MTGPVPPLPVAAQYTILGDVLAVTFDRVLVGQPVLGGTLTLRVNNFLRRAVGAVAAGNFVTAGTVGLGPNAGPDVLNYAPPPFDIVDLATGGLTVAFANFPLTVLP